MSAVALDGCVSWNAQEQYTSLFVVLHGTNSGTWFGCHQVCEGTRRGEAIKTEHHETTRHETNQTNQTNQTEAEPNRPGTDQPNANRTETKSNQVEPKTKNQTKIKNEAFCFALSSSVRTTSCAFADETKTE